ncbi:MAG: hypothetical protein KF745_00820 [Phycisphaeraceae bacterium]|nr:hypothetical protein [Phycisphaeraceae bacterium]
MNLRLRFYSPSAYLRRMAEAGLRQFRFERAAMWRTPQGNRVLKGAEARAFKAGLSALVEELAEWGDDHESSVEVFDSLSYGQRLALLEDIAGALLDPSSVSTPAHTAASEAAIYAVYKQLLALVEFELDAADSFDIRSIIRAGCYERGLKALADNDDDLEEWTWAIEDLSDQVLWDRDFEDGKMFLDAAPDHGANTDVEIDGDYFASIPRELRDPEITPTIDRLRRIGA